jgi:hypothetical protein
MNRNRPPRVVSRARASGGSAAGLAKRKRGAGPFRFLLLAGLCAIVLACAAWVAWGGRGTAPKELRQRAERELAKGNWLRAAELLHAYNNSPRADSRLLAEEAKAWLAADKAKTAGLVVDRELKHSPAEAAAWLVKLEILRVLDRTRDALAVGNAALAAVDPQEKLKVLRAATIVALEPYPDDLARERLSAWLSQEPERRDLFDCDHGIGADGRRSAAR